MDATYNCRSLRSNDQVCDLENETSHNNWHLSSLSEVRRTEEDQVILGHDTNSQKGVGFLIDKNLLPPYRLY